MAIMHLRFRKLCVSDIIFVTPWVNCLYHALQNVTKSSWKYSIFSCLSLRLQFLFWLPASNCHGTLQRRIHLKCKDSSFQVILPSLKSKDYMQFNAFFDLVINNQKGFLCSEVEFVLRPLVECSYLFFICSN